MSYLSPKGDLPFEKSGAETCFMINAINAEQIVSFFSIVEVACYIV
jgi:hypothetical protein